MRSRPALTFKGHGEWVALQTRMVDRAVELLGGLVHEYGADVAFSRRSPEFDLVVNLLSLAKEAGGGIALDALVQRIRRRLAGVLDRAELAVAMADLQARIADLKARP